MMLHKKQIRVSCFFFFQENDYSDLNLNKKNDIEIMVVSDSDSNSENICDDDSMMNEDPDCSKLSKTKPQDFMKKVNFLRLFFFSI